MADLTPRIDLTTVPRIASLLVPLDGSRLAEAERLDVDLLGFATHAQSGITGLWNASFGSKVLSRYTRPLLLVPAR